MSNFWKKVDQVLINNIQHLNANDNCYYAKDYVPGVGYQGSIVNDDILNFKKAPGSPGQQHRARAVNKFAVEVSTILNCDQGRKFYVTAVPSSKNKHDPMYDRRFEDLFEELKKFSPCIEVVWPVVAINSVQASHHSGSRDPDVLKQNYNYSGFAGIEPESLIVFDDVLTSGAHFRAYKDFIIESGYQGKVFGVFWAKTI